MTAVRMRVMAEGAIFDTLQGEGDLAGVPTTFLRLAGCDLRCARDLGANTGWSCDTPHSLPDYDTGLKMFKPTPTRFAQDLDVQDLAQAVLASKPSHIVITGGEPTLQDEALVVLLAFIEHEALLGGRKTHVTLETNARRFSALLARRIDLVSMSPKVYQPKTIAFEAISDWCHTARAVQVKIVLADLDPEAVTTAVSVFQTVRGLRQDATLYVQRADVSDDKHVSNVHAQKVMDWVMNDQHLRGLGVRFGGQQHKTWGVA